MDSKKTYGSPKITKSLLAKGFHVSQKRVARRMKALGIFSIVVKKYKPYSSSKKKVDDSNKHNLLNQDFSASKPSLKWVGDITYIYTLKHGWTYLATVMDLFDLKIIGYAYSTRMTADLACEALNMAVANRSISSDTIFHSDLGSQYTSIVFESLLSSLHISHSYSKKGCPYDNACMESWNSIFKKELVYTTSFANFNDAKLAIFDFIESWYNNSRIHSSLNYLSPNQFFNNYLALNNI